jgi:hypothetical protein
MLVKEQPLDFFAISKWWDMLISYFNNIESDKTPPFIIDFSLYPKTISPGDFVTINALLDDNFSIGGITLFVDEPQSYGIMGINQIDIPASSKKVDTLGRTIPIWGSSVSITSQWRAGLGWVISDGVNYFPFVPITKNNYEVTVTASVPAGLLYPDRTDIVLCFETQTGNLKNVLVSDTTENFQFEPGDEINITSSGSKITYSYDKTYFIGLAPLPAKSYKLGMRVNDLHQGTYSNSADITLQR